MDAGVPNDKPPKPPPIFVDKVSNIQPLLQLLKEIADGNFDIKVLSNDKVRIQPQTAEIYSKIVKCLQLKDTEFHTYKPKSERSFKVVLKNLHPSTDIEEIKKEITENGHTVTNIWNIRQRATKKPLSMFFIEVEANDNNKDIYNIQKLLHCRVVVEPPRPKREIPQCGKCQQYGHTKKYCHRKPKCIKCAGDHLSIDCTRKGRSDNVKCVLCDGNHPANYKGCQVYKQLQTKQPITNARPKTMSNLNPKNKITEFFKPVDHPPKHSYTYSEALKSPNKNSNKNPNKNTKTNTDDANGNNQNQSQTNHDMHEMMNTMKQLMQQITSMTNLLLELMTKISSTIH